MAITPGRNSITYQALTTSYETAFAASAPSGAGSNGSPVRLFYLTAAGDSVIAKITRFNQSSTDAEEVLIDAGETLPIGCFTGGITKLEVKGSSTSSTVKWSDSIP